MVKGNQGLGTYYTVIHWGMRCVALCIGLFTVTALASQFIFGSRFLDRDLDGSEVLILLAGNAFAWIVVAIFPGWVRFVESVRRR